MPTKIRAYVKIAKIGKAGARRRHGDKRALRSFLSYEKAEASSAFRCWFSERFSELASAQQNYSTAIEKFTISPIPPRGTFSLGMPKLDVQNGQNELRRGGLLCCGTAPSLFAVLLLS